MEKNCTMSQQINRLIKWWNNSKKFATIFDINDFSVESACRVNNGDCEQVCLEGSVRGHYRCGCREGYQLKSDSRTCECKYTPEQELGSDT